jgi:flagellar FliJ protein
MPRFEFRLKTLLAVREAARDLARTQLAELLAQQDSLSRRRAHLEREVNDQKQWLRRGTAPGRIDVDRLSTANRYELVLGREISTIMRHEQTLTPEIEGRRQAVVEADREVRVLEKLRERQFEQFRQQRALAEVKQLDEVAARAMDRHEPA